MTQCIAFLCPSQWSASHPPHGEPLCVGSVPNIPSERISSFDPQAISLPVFQAGHPRRRTQGLGRDQENPGSRTLPPDPRGLNGTMGHGYWGPITASVDWCEGNYEVTMYVAEFMNTLSSIPVALMGLCMLRQAVLQKRSTPLHMAAIAMTIIGIGSVAFHGTLTRQGQLLDELPMVWGICAYLYATLYHMAKDHRQMSLALNCTIAWGVLATVLYFVLGFVAFVVMFAATVFLATGVAYLASSPAAQDARMRRNSVLKRRLAAAAAGIYLFAFAGLWIPEQIFCGNRLERRDPPNTIVQSMHFHAVFHLLSAIAPYLFLCFILVLEVENDASNTSHIVWERRCESLYAVHIPIVIEDGKEP